MTAPTFCFLFERRRQRAPIPSGGWDEGEAGSLEHNAGLPRGRREVNYLSCGYCLWCALKELNPGAEAEVQGQVLRCGMRAPEQLC